MAKAKKRNPQDTTLRNTRAANARLTALEEAVRILQRAVVALDDRIEELMPRLR